MIPRYTHDCDKCRYLGRCDYRDPWSEQWVAADLYFCEKASTHHAGTALAKGTCLARVGHEAHEYASTPLYIAERYEPPFSTHGRALYVAALAVISERRRKDTP